MKVVLPMAGLGSRLRPHTWSKPKPLMRIAGKPVLSHVLDYVLPVGVDEGVFIIGWLGDQIKAYVDATYDLTSHYVVQKELQGQAHALYLAKDYLSGPCLITWIDTLFRADLSGLEECDSDVVAFTKEAEDPRPYGVAVQEKGRVVRLIEKPRDFEHRQVVVGVYYVADGAKLVEAIETLLERDTKTDGEYYLADAFNVMLENGAKMTARPVTVWEDTGVPDTVLQSNRYLLESGASQEIPTQNSVLIPPVHVAVSATIENSVVGPHVSIGEGTRLSNTVVRDAVIGDHSTIENAILEHSLIGSNTEVKGSVQRLNLGDDSSTLPL